MILYALEIQQNFHPAFVKTVHQMKQTKPEHWRVINHEIQYFLQISQLSLKIMSLVAINLPIICYILIFFHLLFSLFSDLVQISRNRSCHGLRIGIDRIWPPTYTNKKLSFLSQILENKNNKIDLY